MAEYSVFMSQEDFVRTLDDIPQELKRSPFGEKVRDNFNEHLVECWLTGGKERYEGIANG